MKRKLKSEQENVMIVDEPVWTVKPKGTYSDKTFRVALGNKFLQSSVIADNEDIKQWKERGYKILNVPVDFRANFMDDIDRAMCDYAGISSSEISKYISGVSVREVISDKITNPFTKEILEVGNASDDTAQYKDFFDMDKVPYEMKSRPLFIHLDMSVSGDMTGIAGVWIKGKKTSTQENQAKDLFYSLAFSVSIKAPKGRQISFEKNRNFIYWLKEQGFNIKGITSDTYQSYDTGQTLKAKGFPYEVLSVDKVDTDRISKPYQYLKSTIYEKRIELYDSKNLIDELIDLERNINTGKVDHPDSGKKDVADALCGSVYSASKNAEQFAFEWGENLDTIAKTNSLPSDQSLRQQITLEFEEELKKTFNKNLPKPEGQEKSQIKSQALIGDGIMIW
jgi:hypothetical protein